VTVAQAFVQRHATYVDFLSLQRASEQNRTGGDPSHQIGSSVPLARHGRDPSPGQACGFTPPQPGRPAQRHGCRASSRERVARTTEFVAGWRRASAALRIEN